MNIKKILYPTDFSEPAENALEYAVFMAKTHHADLALLHVVDQLHGFTHYEILAMTPMEIAEKMTARTLEDLQAIADRVNGAVTAKPAVREGKAWLEICEAAQEENADLIVMGSHGRSGLSHVLLGSVAEKVVRHAACPVLVVREPGD